MNLIVKDLVSKRNGM